MIIARKKKPSHELAMDWSIYTHVLLPLVQAGKLLGVKK